LESVGWLRPGLDATLTEITTSLVEAGFSGAIEIDRGDPCLIGQLPIHRQKRALSCLENDPRYAMAII